MGCLFLPPNISIGQFWAKLLNEVLKRVEFEIESRFFSRIGKTKAELLLSIMVHLKSSPSRFKGVGSFKLNEPNLRFLDFSWVGIFSNLSH